jgi:hypothetical protein
MDPQAIRIETRHHERPYYHQFLVIGGIEPACSKIEHIRSHEQEPLTSSRQITQKAASSRRLVPPHPGMVAARMGDDGNGDPARNAHVTVDERAVFISLLFATPWE